MKKDCILYRQVRNEFTGEIKNEFCILNEKAQNEMERTEKCGTYACPFYKESEDELRTIEEDKKRFTQEIIMGKKETSKVVFVQHFGQSRIYAFNIDFDVKCGDYLLAETQKGDSVVRAISDSVNIETDKIVDIIQQYAVISKIKHKLELRVDLGFDDNKLP